MIKTTAGIALVRPCSTRMRARSLSGSFCVLTLCLLAAAGRVSAADPLEQKISIDIAANTPLDEALIQWGAKTGLQVMMDTNTTRHDRAPALRGTYRAADALAALLNGSGLNYKISADTVTLSPITREEAKRHSFRLAEGQAPESQGGSQNGAATSDEPENTPSGELGAARKKRVEAGALEEIVVTGTHIKGAIPVGSPIVTVTAEDIQNSGYSTIGDIIRSVPQASGGGINPGVVGARGSGNSSNVSSASTVNLRGLGSSSTLTLIDGHRLAYDGLDSSVDISVIPPQALERIEILTDSASSIYGADAVAGVANFILKKDYEGALTTLHYGDSTAGGAAEWEAGQLVGVNWAGGNAMLSYEHFDQDSLLASDRAFSSAANRPQTLLPEQKRDSVFIATHQSLSDSVSAHFEGLYSQRTADIITNYRFPVYTNTDTTIFGISPGIEWRLSPGWSASIDGTLSASNNDQEISPFEPFDYANRTATVEAQANGPLLQLPSGAVQAAAGSGYRSETYHDEGGTAASRHVTYEFAEISVPLVRPDPARAWLERAELSFSGRHEDYSDLGTSTTPKIGLAYGPTTEINLRASWGKAFRAPNLADEYGLVQTAVSDAADYGVSAPTDAQVLAITGSNPSLTPETARSWTTGLDYVSTSMPGVRANLTYFNIDYRSRIAYPIAQQTAALFNPAAAPFVFRNPSASLQALTVGESREFDDYTSLGYEPSKVIALIVNQEENVSEQHVHGVDIMGAYRWSGALGNLDLSVNAAWLRISQVLTSDSPEEVTTGTTFNPAKFRSRIGATWQRGCWSINSFVNFVSSETDNVGLNAVQVGSWTTVDGQATFDASLWGGFFRGLRLSVTGQNILDRNPPRLPALSTQVARLGFDSTNASALGRYLGLTIRKAL